MLSVYFASAVLLAAGPTLPLAVFVDGKPQAAALRALTGDGMRLETDSSARTIPLADLVSWGQFAEPSRGPLILLADGSLLVADVFKADKEQITIESTPLGTQRLPLDALAGVIFVPPAGRNERDRLIDKVLKAGGDSDALQLDNGDRLTGLLQSIPDGEVDFRADVGPVKLATSRIVALVFNPSLRAGKAPAGTSAAAKPATALWIGLTDGSRVLATGATLDEKSFAFAAAGRDWKTLPRRVCALLPLSPRVTYLSDLKPTVYRFIPYFDMNWPYALDRGVGGGMLRCGGRLSLKGIGLHSTSRLSFALDGTAKRFEAELGIDDETDGGGSVRVRVFVDDRQRYVSETIRGQQPPLPVSLDIAGAKRLDLVVDFADRADVLDHAVLLGARLVK